MPLPKRCHTSTQISRQYERLKSKKAMLPWHSFDVPMSQKLLCCTSSDMRDETIPVKNLTYQFDKDEFTSYCNYNPGGFCRKTYQCTRKSDPTLMEVSKLCPGQRPYTVTDKFQDDLKQARECSKFHHIITPTCSQLDFKRFAPKPPTYRPVKIKFRKAKPKIKFKQAKDEKAKKKKELMCYDDVQYAVALACGAECARDDKECKKSKKNCDQSAAGHESLLWRPQSEEYCNCCEIASRTAKAKKGCCSKKEKRPDCRKRKPIYTEKKKSCCGSSCGKSSCCKSSCCTSSCCSKKKKKRKKKKKNCCERCCPKCCLKCSPCCRSDRRKRKPIYTEKGCCSRCLSRCSSCCSKKSRTDTVCRKQKRKKCKRKSRCSSCCSSCSSCCSKKSKKSKTSTKSKCSEKSESKKSGCSKCCSRSSCSKCCGKKKKKKKPDPTKACVQTCCQRRHGGASIPDLTEKRSLSRKQAGSSSHCSDAEENSSYESDSSIHESLSETSIKDDGNAGSSTRQASGSEKSIMKFRPSQVTFASDNSLEREFSGSCCSKKKKKKCPKSSCECSSTGSNKSKSCPKSNKKRCGKKKTVSKTESDPMPKCIQKKKSRGCCSSCRRRKKPMSYADKQAKLEKERQKNLKKQTKSSKVDMNCPRKKQKICPDEPPKKKSCCSIGKKEKPKKCSETSVCKKKKRSKACDKKFSQSTCSCNSRKPPKKESKSCCSSCSSCCSRKSKKQRSREPIKVSKKPVKSCASIKSRCSGGASNDDQFSSIANSEEIESVEEEESETDEETSSGSGSSGVYSVRKDKDYDSHYLTRTSSGSGSDGKTPQSTSSMKSKSSKQTGKTPSNISWRDQKRKLKLPPCPSPPLNWCDRPEFPNDRDEKKRLKKDLLKNPEKCPPPPPEPKKSLSQKMKKFFFGDKQEPNECKPKPRRCKKKKSEIVEEVVEEEVKKCQPPESCCKKRSKQDTNEN